MAWNFRKKINVAPGVHLNLSKGGVSSTIGVKGASMTVGKGGTYVNTSLPGTGLYSRRKVSSKENISSKDSKQENGSNFGCFLFTISIILLIIVGKLLESLIEMPKDVDDDNKQTLIGYILIFGFLLIVTILPILQVIAKRLKPITVPENYGYDYVAYQYSLDKNKLLRNVNNEVTEAKSILENSDDPIKSKFLTSFIANRKKDCLLDLNSFYSFGEKDFKNIALDPLFSKAAANVVEKQTYCFSDLYDYLGYSIDIERMKLLEKQLAECGIITRGYNQASSSVLINSQVVLNKLLRIANGKSLLSPKDKVLLNHLIEKNSLNENCDDISNEIVATYDSKTLNKYTKLVDSFIDLKKCAVKWEVRGSNSIDNPKSSISNYTERRKRLCCMGSESFDYLIPKDDCDSPKLEFDNNDSELSIYFYPSFVVFAHDGIHFDVIKKEDIDVYFDRVQFIEQNEKDVPKDAKLVGNTFKYVNKNGLRDERYSDNPLYCIYEYANLSFIYQGEKYTMQFSDSDKTERFYSALTGLYKQVETNESKDKQTAIRFDDIDRNTETITRRLVDFYCTLKNENSQTLEIANSLLPDDVGSSKIKFRTLFIADLIKCFEKLGYSCDNLHSSEGRIFSLAIYQIISENKLEVDSLDSEFLNSKLDSISNICVNIKKDVRNYKIKTDSYFVHEILLSCSLDSTITLYFSLLYRFFSIIAKADGNISEIESYTLSEIMSYSKAKGDSSLTQFEGLLGISMTKKPKPVSKPIAPNKGSDSNVLNKLNSLIGLSGVKSELSALYNYIKIQKEREKNGLKTVGLSYHCVFTGNPGTGKTTVARIVAEIYKNLGILKKGHLVETDRSGLVAEYVGQTAVKTNNLIDSALDGILFIDEAYSLVQGSSNDFGNEAISTLLKRMEDNRDRLVVILAGYGPEMKQFIDSNPGLQSRFNRYIDFADYNLEELLAIYKKIAEDNQYRLSPLAESKLSEMINETISNKDRSFGNGRFVRNLFEKSLQNQAVRLSKQPHTTAEELSLITEQDL